MIQTLLAPFDPAYRRIRPIVMSTIVAPCLAIFYHVRTFFELRRFRVRNWSVWRAAFSWRVAMLKDLATLKAAIPIAAARLTEFNEHKLKAGRLADRCAEIETEVRVPDLMAMVSSRSEHIGEMEERLETVRKHADEQDARLERLRLRFRT